VKPASRHSAGDPTLAHRLDVTTLKGVGPSMAERLQKLQIRSVQDLLFHLPFRYQDRTRITPIGALRPGDEAVIEGEVQLSEIKFGKRRMLLTRITDGTGSLTLRFFHFNSAQQQSLSPGTRLRCFGEVRSGNVTLEMVHPEFRRLLGDEPNVEEHLTPIYPTTEGLQMPGLRKLIDQALTLLQEGRLALPDLIPPALLPPGMGRLRESLLSLHRPTPDIALSQLTEGAHPAQQRLAFEELLAHQLSLRLLRQRMRQHPAPALKAPGVLSAQLQTALPFTLTGAQQRVLNEIRNDLQQPTPMQRLVQGDVGCGKTVIAALTALQSVESGLQAAVMAPTELLAEQHYQSFRDWLEPLGITVAWLTGRLKVKERRAMLAAIESGEAAVAVGTHALFQQEVIFKTLGLVIVDEQHRFGVHQRLALREKGVQQDGSHPHQLIMTATPIPRTLAMTAYADLDLSVIDELPPGRTPVETVAITEERREEVVQRVAAACAVGQQAYWVCTLIEESESLQCQAAEETLEQLRGLLPQLRIGLVHGRMKTVEKEQQMAAFKQARLDLLVATTVIEVGVDVPNASLMIIENAERLGLAQLHQLRGRVGRGSTKSSCVLMYHPPLSAQARERLGVLRESNDGFVIARKDLELRGPGEVLGTRQTGMLQLRIADLQRDQALMQDVTEAAQQLLQEYPQQVAPLLERWLGDKQRYSDV
jgi:ATP-dependent DNA helicase RecG